MARYVGLDLGSTYTRLWTYEKGVVLRSPTVAAMDSQTHELVALGERARQMLGKTPENILTFRPVRGGLVKDLEVTIQMLDAFFDNKKLRTTLHRPSVLLATPYQISDADQKASENAIMSAGAKAVAQVPSIFAAAAGAGLRVNSTRGCMVICLGGGLVEVAVIGSGSIISARSLRSAGEGLDMAIISYLKNHRNILIDDAAAEQLKLKIGTADPNCDRGEMDVCGLDATTGLATRRTVSSWEICEAVTPKINAIAHLSLHTLENVLPEMCADVYTFGIMLCGGGALMPGLGQAIADRTGLRVTVAENPMDCVIRGLGMIIRRPTIWGDDLKERIRSIF